MGNDKTKTKIQAYKQDCRPTTVSLVCQEDQIHTWLLLASESTFMTLRNCTD